MGRFHAVLRFCPKGVNEGAEKACEGMTVMRDRESVAERRGN